MKAFIALNGKKAGREDIRAAIYELREQGMDLHVRVTWEGGDLAWILDEACRAGADRIIVGGGDGSLNEMTEALMKIPAEQRIPMGILPLGTANDFANGNNVPLEPKAALQLALQESAVAVDVIRVNNNHCLNMVTAGFGAKVTAETPVDLKNFLGGGAYVLSGMVQALNFVPYSGTITVDGKTYDSNVVVAALGNGRQAGGGQVLCPHAYLNDGYMDLLLIESFDVANINTVVMELTDLKTSGEFVKRIRLKSMEAETKSDIPINLDGEPLVDRRLSIQLEPLAVEVIVPATSPCLLPGA
ncbi:MAG: lipid kinase YegS [Candidatus Pelagadaptatus aseana]|uniref:lipid kinase YegS n=1 Tax=Candidatus Pelagadaptatus aseana TaxID=3120508 RepID=UPI0039B1EE50